MTHVVPTLLFLLVAPIDDPADAARAERARHQGTWRAVAFEREGVATPEEIVETITRTVDGGRVVWKRDGKPFAATTLTLRPDADPKGIDVAPEGGPDRDKVTRGIYRFEGDRLILC